MEEDAPVRAKVADFGLARSITSGIAGTLSTWQWLAPEVINDETGEYHLSSDVYSFGVVLWELLTFKYPFDEYENTSRYCRVIVDGNGNDISMLNTGEVKYAIIHEQLRPSIPADCPPNIRSLIERCWHQSPKKRPLFDDIVYLLSSELGVQLNEINFAKSHQFYRREVVVDLSKSINLHYDIQIDPPPPRASIFLQRWIQADDRFISSMVYDPLTSTIWAGSSDGSIVIYDPYVCILSSPSPFFSLPFLFPFPFPSPFFSSLCLSSPLSSSLFPFPFHLVFPFSFPSAFFSSSCLQFSFRSTL